TTVELMRSGSSKSENGQTEWTRNLQSAYTVSHTDPANAVLKATMEYTIIRLGEIIKVVANEVTSSDKHAREIGVNWATKQCQELLDGGVECIHFYIMNDAKSVINVIKNL
ncbi:MAG: methylenetetrahydrofolate reductase, partial [candidate division Zixibacteria bacterium]|nr:methylenetetrahydrofolate reductase [candidate division Zixibacteria bacterium]